MKVGGKGEMSGYNPSNCPSVKVIFPSVTGLKVQSEKLIREFKTKLLCMNLLIGKKQLWVHSTRYAKLKLSTSNSDQKMYTSDLL